MPRVLGIDYGERRVGLALSDPDEILASPLATVENRGPRVVVGEVAAIAAARGVARIVVGLPLRLDGGETPSTAAAREFAERLRARVGVPVELQDERLTTVAAERSLIESGARRARRREVIDQAAAQLILQGYLDRNGPPPEPPVVEPPP